MRIIIEPGIFRQDKLAERHQDLLALFAMVVKGRRHTIEIEAAERPAYDRWVLDESKLTRELCDLVINKHSKLRVNKTRTRTLRIADSPIPSWEPAELRLPLSLALRVLQQPLQLLFENSRNERRFLGIMTRKEDFVLERLIKEGAVEIQTKGGIDENRMWIEEFGHDPEKTCCTWVMCDSDAKQPWRDASGAPIPERLNFKATKLAETCKKHNIRLHILWRRSIENYVPLRLIETWSQLNPHKRLDRYKAFARLSNEQRYHYNMKKGFSGDEDGKGYADEVGTLYDGLDPSDREALKSGFNNQHGFSIADLFNETIVHDNKAKLYVNEGWCRQDNQREEANLIVESIKELL